MAKDSMRRVWRWLCARKWDRIRARIRHITVEIFLLSLTVLIWVASYRLTLDVGIPSIDSGDLLALLFGAASVALFAISFIVAILAVVGWQGMNDLIQEKTKAGVKEESERIYKELSGRLYSGLGLVFGRVARPTDRLRADRADLLEVAIDFSRDAYNILESLDSDYKTAALNNLIFYLGVRNRREDSEFALSQAKKLWEAATKYERRAFALTYCRIILEFSDDAPLRERVREILQEVRNDPDTQRLNRDEAELYLREFFPERGRGGSSGGSSGRKGQR